MCDLHAGLGSDGYGERANFVVCTWRKRAMTVSSVESRLGTSESHK